MKTKTDPRHCARKIALQTLFEWSMHSIDPHQIAERIIKDSDNEIHLDYKLLSNLIDSVIAHRKELDDRIAIAAPQWPLTQISKVDLTILRMASAELQFLPDVPEKVSIDEAVELAKEFSNDTSGKFINGVLGTVLKNIKNNQGGQTTEVPSNA